MFIKLYKKLFRAQDILINFQLLCPLPEQGQLCYYVALNCTYVMKHWFCAIRLIHVISWKSLCFEKIKQN